ncbi:V-type proton ATPase subunit S1 [Cimex lectularius]|uniref:V-type proton ATPase subunit S1 n=1 Tax=Cimex lectularius TaxID=79782 RepID=A0A8I6S4S5_CIMLE|nr:V-type proton ATPase subunit S1 [Cimex lectularius]
MKVFLFILLSLATNALCGVPVLVWETSPSIGKAEIIPALSQLDTDDFSNYLVKKVHVHKPLIVLFEEETLSIEDFSWKDSQQRGSFPKLQNLTGMSSKVEFLSSVVNPLNALKDLVASHDYVWKKYDKDLPVKPNVVLEVKLDDPLPNEDRPDLLRRHDTDIAEIYSQLLASHSRIVALFTGKHSSWVEVDLNRVRRDAEPTSFVYESKTIKMETPKPVTLKTTTETFNLDNPTETKSDTRESFLRLILKFSKKGNESDSTGITLRNRFDESNGRWTMSSIEIVINGETDTLVSSMDVSARFGRSFKSTGKVIFKNKSGNLTLIFNGLQAEVYKGAAEKDGAKEFSLPDVPEAVFFTAPIWSGLLTSFLLIMILTYGFLMLSDIKTMDRFDDPKGKTIQVNTGDN